MIARIVLTLMRTDVPTLTEGQIAIVRVTVDELRTDPERLSGLLNGQGSSRPTGRTPGPDTRVLAACSACLASATTRPPTMG